jgi:hypothetical protein
MLDCEKLTVEGLLATFGFLSIRAQSIRFFLRKFGGRCGSNPSARSNARHPADADGFISSAKPIV